MHNYILVVKQNPGEAWDFKNSLGVQIANTSKEAADAFLDAYFSTKEGRANYPSALRVRRYSRSRPLRYG
jgi:hypothetical protein